MLSQVLVFFIFIYFFFFFGGGGGVGAGGKNLLNIIIIKQMYTLAVSNRCFNDFTKAFDYVVTDILLYKLIKVGGRGHILKEIKSINENIKSRVKYDNELSDEFSCCLRMRQDECLFPFLQCLLMILKIFFSMYTEQNG